MKRADCEKIIAGLLEQIVNVYREYNPEGTYLTLCWMAEKENEPASICFNNSYFDKNSIDYDRGLYFRKELDDGESA